MTDVRATPATPQFLYHGTTVSAAQRALEIGIRPRREHGRSNWKRTIESNPKTVYLTDAYPLYFAFNAAEHKQEEAAVLQIAVDRLDQLWLVPDEDVLEQAGRGHDGITGSMKKRTRFYRDRILDHLATDMWKHSLEAMGTCGSMKPIPPEAITRVAYVPQDCRQLSMAACDAMIVLANYRFCGTKYRNLTNRLFGLPQVHDPLLGDDLNPDISKFPPDAQATIAAIVEGRKRYDEALAADYARIRIEEVNP
jgi:hypothetical protein